LAERDHVRYFTDENAMGLAKILLRDHARDDLVHPGHALVPEVPRGTVDLDWMPFVGRMGWIVLTRDRRIRTRPAELQAYHEHRLCSVWIGGRQDHTSFDLVEIFIEHERRLERWATKLGAGPWALAMTQSGVRQIGLHDLG
jgi:hypothetical protein